ncbi:MAG: ASKHA domain-containing protein [Limnochordia bacterium]|nr:ASKHA domain-containing protein [Limnochordia bacterium]
MIEIEIEIGMEMEMEKMKKIEIEILLPNAETEKKITCFPGETVYDVLLRSDLAPSSYCGGKGTCGKCKVHWVQAGKDVLACQLPVSDGMIIENKSPGDVQALSTSIHKTFTLEPLVGEGSGYGIAVDIGTTTMVGYLLNLRNGQEMAVASLANPQRAYGADVISRIAYTQSHPEGVQRLQEVLVAALNSMITTLCEQAQVDKADVLALTTAGNTVMLHTLLGVNAVSIANAPFEPVFSDQKVLAAQDLGIEIGSQGKVFVLPSVSGYVGADILAGLLVCDLDHQDSYGLLIDIGTNGEIVLGNEGKILACSTAAGPAFEGANISSGMAGIWGALSSFRIQEEAGIYETIGGIRPVGICGSGLIDIMAELLKHGFVDASGAFAVPSTLAKWKQDMLTTEGGMPAFLVTEEILFTQKDVREVQLAKGALRAGILTLLKEAGIEAEQIGQVYLAGGFGNFVDVHHACAMGLIPLELEERVTKIGNGAGLGAKLSLLDQSQLVRCTELKQRIQYIELSTRADFQELFMEAMFF